MINKGFDHFKYSVYIRFIRNIHDTYSVYKKPNPNSLNSYSVYKKRNYSVPYIFGFGRIIRIRLTPRDVKTTEWNQVAWTLAVFAWR